MGTLLADADYRLLAEFRHELRRFLRFSEEAAWAAGLEPQQQQLLLAVKGAPEGVQPTVGWLAARLQIRHHSAVGLIDRLEEHGLVARSRGERDHRQMVVSLTERGERLVGELSASHRAELQAMAPALIRALQALLPAAVTAGDTSK